MSRRKLLEKSLTDRSFVNKYGDAVVVVHIINAKNVVVEFEDGFRKSFQKDALLKGTFKSPYSRTLYGVGYLGEGDYLSKDASGNYTNHYILWHNILSRVYSPARNKSASCYSETVVCDKWLNFQNFSAWCDKQVGFYERDDEGKKFAIDKDLIARGNSVYSPKTCCFVPAEINSFMTKRDSCRGYLPIGVSIQNGRYKATCNWIGKAFYFDTQEEAFFKYKQEKELKAKSLAYKWKPFISEKAFNCLVSYTVNMND